MRKDTSRTRKVGKLITGWCELIRLGYADGTVSWAVRDPSGGLAIFGKNVHGAKIYVRGLVSEFGVPEHRCKVQQKAKNQ